MNRLLICAISLSFVMVGCKKELEPQESTATTPDVSSQIEALNSNNVQPVAAPQTTNMQPQPVATASGLNPAHGQPGHRCDIAVGAPLNSKPGQAPVQTAQATMNSNGQVSVNPSAPIKINQSSQPVQQTAPGMNPPHGQPGHRCDIAVGAPLSSAAKSSTPAAATVVPVVQDASGKFKVDEETKVKVTTSNGQDVPPMLQAPKE